jgi:RNA methyltransferase, TrmH family
MITKNELKYYASLKQKKHRKQENKFLAEGEKVVLEGITAKYPCELVLMTSEFHSRNEDIAGLIKKRQIRIEIVKNNELEKLSDTKTPQGIIAVFESIKIKFELNLFMKDPIIVFLDNISDPGNVGTILRTCDWFGIKNLLLSSSSAEYLNPKVIRSSMGSVFHLNIFENSEKYLSQLKENGYKIISSDLNGQNIFNYKIPDRAVIVLSNESSGPTSEILMMADEKITIPGKGKAESLNVASAAAIILVQLVRYNKIKPDY